MKLAAIYNVWDDWDLLEHSLKHIRRVVDGVVIVASSNSNHGEISFIPDWPDVWAREPHFKNARDSETDKRNYGIGIAKEQGYTHFLMMDADEFYEPEPFLKAKQRFIDNPNLAGLVCPCQTYFKSPQLTIGIDPVTLVPFIHKLTPTIRHGLNKSYPFAWINGQIRIDPTRQLNISSGVERTDDVIMHHYSWVRSDFDKKIRNSTAKANLERSTIMNDLVHAKEGYFVEFYQRHLQRSTVDFGIPELSTHDQTSICKGL
jgi:hypothetical protein